MEKKVALITGASRGIGKAIALQLASEGYDVAINFAGSTKQAEEVKEACIQKGVKAITIQADVSNSSDVDRMFEEVMDTFGQIDVLVNNSGITKDNLLLRMKDEEFDRVVDVNLKGTYYCIQRATRIMMKQRSGSIINMASVIGQIGNIGQANYAASKAGIIGLTKSAAKELAARGVRVNAIAPGFIQTEMTEVLDEAVIQKIQEAIPLKELGHTEDIAHTVSFLASKNSRYITGQVINVDGGMVM